MKKGIERIAEERKRQVAVEGWTPEHDASHTDGSLAVTAATLAVCGTDAEVHDPLGRGTVGANEDVPEDGDCWGLVEKHKNSRIRQLVIAGALIAAEIDRVLDMSKR